MPVINAGQLYVAPLLSRLATKYRNRSYVYDRVLLPVEVPFDKGVYHLWDDVPAFFRQKTTYGPDGAVNLMFTSPTKVNFTCLYHALGALIDPAEEQQAPGINIELVKTEALTDAIQLDTEVECAALLTSPTNGVPNTTLSGTSQWSDYTNSDPAPAIDGFAQAMYVDKSQLSLLIGRAAYDKLARHPKALDAIKYTTPGANIAAEDGLMARWLGLKEVIVASALQNTANPGQTETLAPVWGKNALLFYKPDRPPTPLMEQPAFGYLPRRGGTQELWRVYRSIPNPMVGSGEGQRGLKVETIHVPLLTGPKLGFLIINAVA